MYKGLLPLINRIQGYRVPPVDDAMPSTKPPRRNVNLKIGTEAHTCASPRYLSRYLSLSVSSFPSHRSQRRARGIRMVVETRRCVAFGFLWTVLGVGIPTFVHRRWPEPAQQWAHVHSHQLGIILYLFLSV